MKKEHLKISILFLISLCFLAFCLPTQKVAPNSEQAEVNSSPPKRIISLSPQNTEIIFALGAGERLVGVTNYCDYPAEALQKEKIGDFICVDFEKIVELNPDLVIANSTLQDHTINQLKKLGIKVIIVQNDSLDELLVSIEKIGDAIGYSENGKLLRQKLEKKQQQILAKMASSKQTKIFVEVWDRPLLTVGNRSHIHDMITKLGALNIAGQSDREYYPWNIEALYANEPDIYLRLRGTDMGSKADELPLQLQELQAVKNKKVVTLFNNAVVRSGPRSFDVLEELATVLSEKEKE